MTRHKNNNVVITKHGVQHHQNLNANGLQYHSSETKIKTMQYKHHCKHCDINGIMLCAMACDNAMNNGIITTSIIKHRSKLSCTKCSVGKNSLAPCKLNPKCELNKRFWLPELQVALSAYSLLQNKHHGGLDLVWSCLY